MKRSNRFKRGIALILTTAFLIGLFPTAALAAEELDLIKFKAMQMVNLFSNAPVSTYEYETKKNTFQTGLDLSHFTNEKGLDEGKSWVKLIYTIEKSQKVSLELYQLEPVTTELDEKKREYCELDYDADGNPEPFLGRFVGYIYGTNITDHVKKLPEYEGASLEDAPRVDSNPLSKENWNQIIYSTVQGKRSPVPMIDQYVFGFNGEKLNLGTAEELGEAAVIQPTESPAPEAESRQQENMVETQKPEDTTLEESTTCPDEETETTDEALEAEMPAAEERTESDLAEESQEANPEKDVSDATEPAATEEAQAHQSEPTPAPNPALRKGTEADVLIQRESSVGLAPFSIDDALGKLQNYVLWDGKVVANQGGEAFYPDYEDGHYVIVMQPSTPEVSMFNSFLAFDVQKNDQTIPFSNSMLYQEIYDWVMEFGCPGDPVNLLTGSFTWNYTDTALFGRDTLAYIRYYQSKDGAQYLGLGNGWTSNLTAMLEIDTLYAKAILANGIELYFPLQFDGSYAQVGDYRLQAIDENYTLTTKDNTVYLFNHSGQIQTIESLDGNKMIFGYDDQGRVNHIRNSTGSFTLAYNRDGNLASLTDSTGRVTKYSYQGEFLTSMENTDGDSLVYTYTSNGYLETVKNFKDQVYVENTYDSWGRVVHQYAKDMGTFDFTYNQETRTNTCIGEDGSMVRIQYDALGVPCTLRMQMGPSVLL